MAHAMGGVGGGKAGGNTQGDRGIRTVGGAIGSSTGLSSGIKFGGGVSLSGSPSLNSSSIPKLSVGLTGK